MSKIKTMTSEQRIREAQRELRAQAERVREILVNVERIVRDLKAEPGDFAAVVSCDAAEALHDGLEGAVRELQRAARHSPRGVAVRSLKRVREAA